MFLNEDGVNIGGREVIISNLHGKKVFTVMDDENLSKVKIVAEGFKISLDGDQWADEFEVDFSQIMKQKLFVAPLEEISSGLIRIEDIDG